MDLGFTTDPNMHRAPRSGPFRVRIEAGQLWVARARISRKVDSYANQSMFCELQTTNILESKSEVEMGKTIMLGRCWITQTETPPLRNKAQLNCVSLRSVLDYEVAWKAVKGRDERPLRDALDSSPSYDRIAPMSEIKLRRAATSALTFITFS
jgi:hypothetical protein